MKIKYTKKTEKVKSISFHPTRQNWVAMGLFTGEIQILDFRNNHTMISIPTPSCIRTVSFHPLQSLLISAGDENLIRGYDYMNNQQTFSLEGHADYIRTVQFHSFLPWILSSSDDQTIRIWNWQSKQQLSVITGHGHYVMCAKFHPEKDLIVSGSLDSTFRIWDYSKLKSKFSSQHGTLYMLSSDVEAFVIAEAHMKGVNWVSFSPKENLLATCSDDQLIKIWQYTGSNATEQNVFHGHNGIVSCVEWDNDGERLFSNGEDCQIRIWDKKGNCLNRIDIEGEKLWTLDIHHNMPLIAVGCDKSVKMVSFGEEKIYSSRKDDFVVQWSNLENCLKLSDMINNTTKSFSVGYKGNQSEDIQVNCLRLNPYTKGRVEGFYRMKNKGSLMFFAIRMKDLYSYGQEMTGKDIAFVNGQQFVLLKQDKMHLYDIEGFKFKEILPFKVSVDQIFEGIQNHILIRSKNYIIMMNLQTKKIVFKFTKQEIDNLIHVKWNEKRKYCILQFKKLLMIIDKKGNIKAQVFISNKIKSMIWKDNLVIYNDHEHVKYLLINGEKGTIKSIDQIIFLVRESEEKLIFLNIKEEFEQLEIDTSEILIKQALLEKDFEKVKKLLKENQFFGKSIVSYILKTKQNFLSSQLAQDSETAFYLALHSEQLQEAFDLARELNDQEKFKLLADAATNCGAFSLAEVCLKLSNQKEKLQSHYLMTGNQRELKNLQFSNINQKFNHTLFTGDIRERVRILAECGQISLAYASAKLHNLQDFIEALENAVPNIQTKVKIPENSQLLLPPKPLVQNPEESQKILINWPVIETEEEIEEIEKLSSDEENFDENDFNQEMFTKSQGGGLKYQRMKKTEEVVQKQEIKVDENIENAWGADQELDLDLSDVSQEGEEKKEDIIRNSIVAWQHFVVGDIEGGIKLLQNQVGLRRVENIQNIIDELSKNSNGIFGEDLPNNYDKSYFQKVYNNLLEFANNAKLQDCLELLENNVKKILVANVKENDDQQFFKDMLRNFLNYYIAFQAKIKNDNEKDLNRKTELSLIMSMSNLEPAHALLILQIAVNNLYKLGNFVYCSFVAKKYLKIANENSQVSKQDSKKKMEKILKVCSQKGSNKFDLGFQENDLGSSDWYMEIDLKNLKKSQSRDMVFCPFDLSHYDLSEKGKECEFCHCCEIGYTGLGLKLTNS